MKTGIFVAPEVRRYFTVTNLTGMYSGDHDVVVREVGDLLSAFTLQEMLACIKSEGLEAVVLVEGSPIRFAGQEGARYILDTLVKSGINWNHITFVNLVEQVIHVHPAGTKLALDKAKLLMAAGLEKVRTSPAVKSREVAPRQATAVIGASSGGIACAQRLLERGYRVYLIDPRRDPADFCPEAEFLFAKSYTVNHPRLGKFLGARLKDVWGFEGDFTIQLESAGEEAEIQVGAIVLADVEHPELLAQLHPLFGVDVAEDCQESDMLALEQVVDGIYVVRHEGRSYWEIMAVANSVVLSVLALFSQREIYHPVLVSQVNEEFCGGCGTCVKTCMFHASSIDPRRNVSVIDVTRCKGCGNCVTSCPAGARDLLSHPQKYLFRAVEILAQYEDKPKVLALACDGCGYAALDEMGHHGQGYPEGLLPVAVRCGGAVDTQLILHAFHVGFDGVMIFRCPDGKCHNIVGNLDLDRRANLFREILRSRGIADDRLRIVDSHPSEFSRCREAIHEVIQVCGTGGVANAG